MQTQFKRHVAYCAKIPANVNLYELSERLKDVSSLYKEFRELQDEIEGECEDDIISDQYEIRSKVEDSYYFCVSVFQTEIDKNKLKQEPQHQQQQQQPQQNNNADIKLPRITITKFLGDYKSWPSFKDTYVSLIHDNKTLRNVQKFHYLMDNLDGKPKDLLKPLHVTDDNYPEAWKRLCGRYQHKRFIVESHLQSFFSLQPMKFEDSAELKKLIDSSTETIQALQVLGLPVNQWDAILVHVVVSKLDSETHKQWELKLTKDDLPTFKQLEEFLEARWQSLEMITNSKSQQRFIPLNQHSKNQKFQREMRSSTYSQPTSTNTISSNFNQNNFNCNYCGKQDHNVTNCGEYLALSYESKNNFIKSKSLCFNCLRTGHSLNSCKSKSSC